MSSYNELEEMLKAFRCQDLANLLSFAGQSKNGKKSELYDRCINILKKGNPNIQMKIKEIYNNKSTTSTINNYSSLMSAINSNSNSGSSSPDPSMLNRYAAPNSSSSSSSSNSAMPPIYNNSFNQFSNNHSIPQNGAYQPHTVINTRSNTMYGIGTAGNSNFSNSTQPVRVQFEKLAFFQFLHELYPASKMQIVNPNQRQYSFWFNFFMTIDQANEITGTREMIVGKLEYSKQIHLRFGFFDPTIQADNLPPNLVVNVNGRPAQLPAPKPTSKPNADIIRPGRSIDVTSLCRLAPNIPNKVEIQWTNPDPSKHYCVGVYVFKKVSVATLVENLKKNCLKDAEVTRQMVREKLQITDSDLEIETDTLKVSLHCPLMKTRLQLPGRSYKCKHVQCFELESYLMMNEKKPTWNCPVCDQHAPYDDLIIDGLNQEIITKCTDADEVVFAADGSWSKLFEQDKTATSTRKKEESKKTSLPIDDEPCVELCDSPPPVKRTNSSNENPFIQPTTTTSIPSASSTNSDNNKKDDDIIDLTCDSDEEMPLQQTTTISTNTNHTTSNKTNGIITTTTNNINNINLRSISRSSSNSSSSIYNNQNSTEAHASSSDSNTEELNRSNNNNNSNNNLTNNNNTNSNIIMNNNNNNNNNKINEKEIRSINSNSSGQSTLNGLHNLSPSQSIISLSSNSSILDDHSRSQTPTNLDQLNTNANNIITNISKLFQNDALSLSRPGTASSSASTITSVPMETTASLTTSTNPILSNSQLARGLSAPSPTRTESMSISPSHSNLRPSSSNASLNSIPNILENINKNVNLSNSNLNTTTNTNKLYSPNSKLSPGQQSPIQQAKIIARMPIDMTQQQQQSRPIDERLIKPPQLIASQQQQRANNNTSNSYNNNNNSKSSNIPQKPNEHTLINKSNNVNKPHKKTEYLTKEKALMVNEELKSMQSNPNVLEQNYKNRQSNSVVVNPQLMNKVRPPTLQPTPSLQQQQHQSNFNSFDSDQIASSSTQNNQFNKNTHLMNKLNSTNPVQINNNNNNIIKPSQLSNSVSGNNTNKLPIPAQQQSQQSRASFDPNRSVNTELRKQLNPELQQQQQRNINNSNHNSNMLNNPSKMKPSNPPNMNIQQQQHQKQMISSSQQQYRNNQPQVNSTSNNINSSGNSKQVFTSPNNNSNNNRPIQNNQQQNYQNQQINYQKSMSHPSINHHHQQPNQITQPIRPTPYPAGTQPIQNNFYSNHVHQQQHQQQHHLQMQQQQLRHHHPQQQQTHQH